jgi:hypothetical protein
VAEIFPAPRDSAHSSREIAFRLPLELRRLCEQQTRRAREHVKPKQRLSRKMTKMAPA